VIPTTRLAPSPTGALHLGNARTFVLNWILARQNNWRVVLRIDDLDGPRIKTHADQQAIEDLRWLGLDWDAGPTWQRAVLDSYKQLVDPLIESGKAYPCTCSRKEVELAASAPHAEDGAAVYPGTCRGKYNSIQEAITQTGRTPAVRFRVPDRIIRWHDEFVGEQICDVARQLGDFVIAKADKTPAYQLAVVFDDLKAGITHVVRGDDLLDSTPRQMLIYEALGESARIPKYFHLPLVTGTDGRRLAKRHGDTRISTLRDSGISSAQVLQWIAQVSGMQSEGVSNAADLVGRFSLQNLPRAPVVFDPAAARF